MNKFYYSDKQRKVFGDVSCVNKVLAGYEWKEYTELCSGDYKSNWDDAILVYVGYENPRIEVNSCGKCLLCRINGDSSHINISC
jgi:hypothetical protein